MSRCALDEENSRSLYVPERFAHGYQTLVDATETSYYVGEFYTPDAEGGLPADDPRLGLSWPLPVSAMSAKDSQWPGARRDRARVAQPNGGLG